MDEKKTKQEKEKEKKIEAFFDSFFKSANAFDKLFKHFVKKVNNLKKVNNSRDLKELQNFIKKVDNSRGLKELRDKLLWLHKESELWRKIAEKKRKEFFEEEKKDKGGK